MVYIATFARGLGGEARKLKDQYGYKIKIVSGKSELEKILKGK